MTRSSTLLFALLAATGLGLAEAPAGERLVYRFDEVKSKVVRAPGGDEERGVRVSAGDPAEAGDVVKTGLFGRTVLAVPDRAARFEVFSSTQVRLAGGEPGVLLVLEKGRLKAAFDAFTGASEARRVAAPGALLAVRGTRYGLEVSGSESVLAVFEGTVEVFPAGGTPSLRVEHGEYCVFSQRFLPRKEKMRKGGMSEKSWGSRGSGMTDGGPGGQDRSGGPGAGSQRPPDAGSRGRSAGGGGGRGAP